MEMLLSAPIGNFCLLITNLEIKDNLRRNNFTCYFANMVSQVNEGTWTQGI
jgi:hypothetical protein